MSYARLARAGMRFAVPRTAGFNGLRTYATPAEVKPPVALFGVDGTYATALVCQCLFLLLLLLLFFFFFYAVLSPYVCFPFWLDRTTKGE